AIAGPLVSLVLGVAFVLLAVFAGLPSAEDGVVAWLGYINLSLLVFNLLPALPLDGGRVLHSLLWYFKGDLAWATRIAADVGRGCGTAGRSACSRSARSPRFRATRGTRTGFATS